MFTDRLDRWEWLIGLAISASVFAGVYWLRSRPVERPTLATQVSEARKDIAVFRLTEPLPQAQDGVREVMPLLHECLDSAGRKTFSERPCAKPAKAAAHDGRPVTSDR